MIVIVIVAVLLIGGIAAFVVISKGKKAGVQAPAAATPAARPTPAAAAEPQAAAPPAPLEATAPKKTVKKVVKKPAAVVEPPAPVEAPAPAEQPQMAAPAVAPTPEPPEILLADLEQDEGEDEDDGVTLSRFGGPPAKPKPVAGEAKVEPAKPRYMMEAPLDDLKAQIVEPEPAPEPVVVVEEPPAVPESTPVVAESVAPGPAFDPTLTVVAPLSASAVAEMNEDEDKDEDKPETAAEEPLVETAEVPDLQLAPELDLEASDDDIPLSEIVADLIDAADPEVAEVMAKLIDASDPELVAELVGSNELEVAEVVARLVDAADPDVRSLVAELADAPDRRQVAEVLRLVDAAYTGVSGESPAGELSPEIAQKLEELDLEADLDLTSRPGEMAQFARLDNRDQLRVIIRVLVGLVAREDLPQSPRMPAEPASSAENRRWPLSRARWPVPPPDGEVVVKRDPLPGRRTSTKAS